MNYIKLDELVWFQEGPGVRNYQYTSAGVKLINVTNLVSKHLDLSLTDRYISEEEAYGKYKHFLCEDGDLVIASSGITYNSIPKKVSFVRKCDLPLCMNTSVIRFKTLNNETIHIKYLYYFFKSNAYRNQISKLMTGSAQLNYGPAHLHKVVLNKTALEEQEHRIHVLDKVTNTMELCENQLTLLDELVKSRFIELFKTIDLSEQKDDWMEIESVSQIITGTTPSTNDESNWGGNILWITPAEMTKETFYVYDTARKLTEKGRKSKSLELMPEGTVLLSTRAPIGKVGIVGKPMACNQGFKNFICNNSINPIFLYVLLKNNTDYLNSLGSGTTFLEISKTKIGKMKIPVPEIEKQIEFTEFVKLIDKSKFILEKQKKTLEELYESKLHEYFGE